MMIRIPLRISREFNIQANITLALYILEQDIRMYMYIVQCCKGGNHDD